MSRRDLPTPHILDGLDGDGRDEPAGPDLPLTSIPSVPEDDEPEASAPAGATASTVLVGAALFVLIVAISVLGARYLKMPRSPLDVPRPVEEHVQQDATSEATLASGAASASASASEARDARDARPEPAAGERDDHATALAEPDRAEPAAAVARTEAPVLTQAPPPAGAVAGGAGTTSAPARDSAEIDALRQDLANRGRALFDARKELERERGLRRAAEKSAAETSAALKTARANAAPATGKGAKAVKAEPPLDRKARARLAALEKEVAALRKENAAAKHAAETARATSASHDADVAERDARAEAAEKRARVAESQVQEVRSSHEQALKGESDAVRKLVADLSSSHDATAHEKAARQEAERKVHALESELAMSRTRGSAATSAASGDRPAAVRTAPSKGSSSGATSSGAAATAAMPGGQVTTTSSSGSASTRTHDTSPSTNASDVREPERLRTVPPYYPEDLRRARVGGRVLLRLLIDPSGRVADVQVTKTPDPRLSELATAAARRWTYTPGRKNGSRAQMWITEAVDFRL